MKKNNTKLIILVVLLVGLLIYFLPYLYKLGSISNKKIAESKKNKETKKIETITLESNIIKDLVFPNLNSNIYSQDTYFKNNTFIPANLTNNDILSFAFKQIYSGYLTDTSIQGCASKGKAFNTEYLDFRIKNNISKNISYKYNDFNVYDTEYAGLWKFNGIDTYIYNGNCNTNNGPLYYDLQELESVKAKNDNNTIIITAKVAFAKIENNEYVIYQNPSFNTPLKKGKYTNLDELNNTLKDLNTKKYQYTFKKGLCSYDAYCIEKGEWLNE